MTGRRAGASGGVIVDIQPSTRHSVPVVEHRSPANVVTVELDPEGGRQPGLIAGVEGLGSELFFDAAGELYALELSPPWLGLRVRPAALLRSAVATARPGVLIAHELPDGSLGGRAAIFSEPFGGALFAFETTTEIDPRTHELVALGPGVAAGVSRATSAISFVSVDGFDHRQRVFGQLVSAERDGRAFMDALNAIHTIFLTGAPADFAREASPLAAAAGDERLVNLVDVYARMRTVDAALEDAERRSE